MVPSALAASITELALTVGVSPRSIYLAAARVLNIRLDENNCISIASVAPEDLADTDAGIWIDEKLTFRSLLQRQDEFQINQKITSSVTLCCDVNDASQFVLDKTADPELPLHELKAQLLLVLEQVIINPDFPISKFSLVTDSARMVLPDPTISLGSECTFEIVTQFIEMARQHPTHEALVDIHDSWTYAELNDASNRIASYLSAHGIRKGDFVAVYADRSARLPLSLLGILKAGAAFVILDAGYPDSLITQRIQVAQPKGFIVFEITQQFPDGLAAAMSAPDCCCSLRLGAARGGYLRR